jgi:hypothetical protein
METRPSVKTDTHSKRRRLKLSEILAGHGLSPEQIWPLIPAMGYELPINKTAATPPVWVKKILERLLEKILPLPKGVTYGFITGASDGYDYASITLLLEEGRKLPAWPTIRRRCPWPKALKIHRSRIDTVLANGGLPEIGNYFKGFSYGIECQQREKSWKPSAITNAVQIYKALLNNRDTVERMILQNKTSKEIGEYIAERATLNDGKTTHVDRYCRTEVGKETYLKNFQKLCERMSIPLPPRGRHRT